MRCCFIFLFLLCSRVGMGQTLAELEKQLDSLLKKREKSELVVGLGYGNNPAYGGKAANFDIPIVLKPFISPSLAYYHKSGFFGAASVYHLFDATKNPWFETDLTAGYDYTKHRNFLTGISYTHYLFADSSDVPSTPIRNELFAYFYYRKWWLEPGVVLDFGWGKETTTTDQYSYKLSGRDFNIIAAIRHPFIFMDVFVPEDAILFTPSIGFTLGTANYYSNLKAFQYVTRSTKMKKVKKKRIGQEIEMEDASGFEPRALDLTINCSYLIGRLAIAPSFTLFKPLQGEDKQVMAYFTARINYSF
jgi:hypothetical protein